MLDSKTKKYIPLYLEDNIHTQIHVYAVETHKTIQEVVKPIMEQGRQAILQMLSDISEMKRNAELERIRQEEEQKIIDSNPLKVLGHEFVPLQSLETKENNNILD